MHISIRAQVCLISGAGGIMAAIGAWALPGAAGITLGAALGVAAGILLSSRLRSLLNRLTELSLGVSEDSSSSLTPEVAELADRIRETLEAARKDREEITRLADYDPLTGCLNHRAFQERISSEIQRSREIRQPFSLLVIDLDHFREINDNLGHHSGDEAILKVAETIRATIGETGIPGRYGGEELAVILPGIDAGEAHEIAERIRRNVADFPYLLPAPRNREGRTEVPITVSIGVASHPAHSLGRSGLATAAETALVRSKQLGRNRVTPYGSLSGMRADMDPDGLSRLISDPSLAAIETLAEAVDARDPYTHGHSMRVALYSVAIATEMEFSPTERELLRTAALLHDVGKIGIPDAVLNKPEKLTDDEYAIIKTHPRVGADILAKAPQLDALLPVVLSHHERYDGRGYPDGLSGQQIPRMARILAAADTLDAMTSDRPYRPGRPLEEAMAEIVRCSGTQFEPVVVEACKAAFLGKHRKAA